MTTAICFDQTFEGFLTAVYTALNEELEIMEVCPASKENRLLFNDLRYIPTDKRKARWVWDWLENKGTSELRLVYFAFLSEKEELWLPLLEFIRGLLQADGSEAFQGLPAKRRKLLPRARQVEQEKQKMEAFLRLQHRQGASGYYYLRPVHDILPLLTKYCREHFGSEPWVLIDTKRRYGLRNRAGGVEYFRLSAGSPDAYGSISEGTEAQEGAGALHPLQEAV